MPVYVIFATFIGNENQAIVENRLVPSMINSKLQDMGATVLNQYGPMSSYDVVNVIDVPDDETARKIEQELKDPETGIKHRFMGPYPSINQI